MKVKLFLHEGEFITFEIAIHIFVRKTISGDFSSHSIPCSTHQGLCFQVGDQWLQIHNIDTIP